jgi:hypothetical protein
MTNDAKKAGRPPQGGEAMLPRSFRCSEKQAEKLDRLGGSAWIRAQIDAAPTPRKR